MSEKIPEYVFHQFDYLFDKMDGAHFGEAEIAGILHGAKNNGIYPGADYVYRYIQRLQIRLREEKKRTLHEKYKRCLLRSVIAQMNAIHYKDLFYDAGSEELADAYNRQITIHYKWQKLWLALADKFKEE